MIKYKDVWTCTHIHFYAICIFKSLKPCSNSDIVALSSGEHVSIVFRTEASVPCTQQKHAGCCEVRQTQRCPAASQRPAWTPRVSLICIIKNSLDIRWSFSWGNVVFKSVMIWVMDFQTCGWALNPWQDWRVRDVLAQPVWRDQFGTGVLAPTVLALRSR